MKPPGYGPQVLVHVLGFHLGYLFFDPLPYEKDPGKHEGAEAEAGLLRGLPLAWGQARKTSFERRDVCLKPANDQGHAATTGAEEFTTLTKDFWTKNNYGIVSCKQSRVLCRH